jgi:hypothetical protein
MEKNDKYLESKRIYNSKLSTFQISKDLHKKVKDYCKNNNIKVKDFLEEIIKNKLL